MRTATSSSSRSRGVSSSKRTRGSISVLNRTMLGETPAASAADTLGSLDKNPRSPSPATVPAMAEAFRNWRRVERIQFGEELRQYRPIRCQAQEVALVSSLIDRGGGYPLPL